jgi:hypothetical protein
MKSHRRGWTGAHCIPEPPGLVDAYVRPHLWAQCALLWSEVMTGSNCFKRLSGHAFPRLEEGAGAVLKIRNTSMGILTLEGHALQPQPMSASHTSGADTQLLVTVKQQLATSANQCCKLASHWCLQLSQAPQHPLCKELPGLTFLSLHEPLTCGLIRHSQCQHVGHAQSPQAGV